jgi:hypothetical protein
MNSNPLGDHGAFDTTKMVTYAKDPFNKTTYSLYILAKAEGGNSLHVGPFNVTVRCDESVTISQDNYHHVSAFSQLRVAAGTSELYTFPIFTSDNQYCPIIAVNVSTSADPAAIVAPPAYPEGI